MAKKLYALDVRGKTKEWTFRVWIDPVHLNDWREDGLTIEEISNTIPYWIAELGLAHVWCFFQDLFNFKKPWTKHKQENET